MTHGKPFTLLIVLATAVLAVPRFVRAEADIERFRAKLDKWVEAREILSKERSEWVVDSDYLRATRDLLADEKKALQKEIAEFEALDQDAGEERRMLLVERGGYQRSAQFLAEELVGLERQVLDLAPRLPAPLKKRLEPLLVQIPENPERAEITLGQRLMNVLGVLAQADKWNSTATLVGETRAITGDQKVQVRTLYWGLSQAVYVDARGENAGIGHPTEAGWVFEDDPAIAADAQLLLDIYEGNVDTISFIPIPVAVQSW
jgi:hypothetical protein